MDRTFLMRDAAEGARAERIRIAEMLERWSREHSHLGGPKAMRLAAMCIRCGHVDPPAPEPASTPLPR